MKNHFVEIQVSIVNSKLEELPVDYIVRDADMLHDKWKDVLSYGLISLAAKHHKVRKALKKILLHEKWGEVLRDSLKAALSSRVMITGMVDVIKRIGGRPQQYRILSGLAEELEKKENWLAKEEGTRRGVDLTT